MAAENHTVVLFPSPGIGHLISMVELGKLLLSHSDSSLSISVLSPIFPFDTGSTSSYISSVSSVFPSISFHTLPPIPLLRGGDPGNNYSDMEEIIYENLRSNTPNVQEFLRSLSVSSPVSAFILDFFCYPALEVSQSMGIPSYFFFTSGASVLAFFLNFPVFDKLAAGESIRNMGTTLLDIPGLLSVPVSHMIEPMLDRGPSYFEFVNMASVMLKSDGIIVNTFESLESRAVQGLKQGTCLPGTALPPIYPIGPLIAHRGGAGERHECLSWLDSQPSRSVVYLGFGSRGMFSGEQLTEMAVGLERSGVRFLWVIRAPPIEDKVKKFLPVPEPDLNLLLPTGFSGRIKGRGFVAKSWVPQIDILGHEAVGGFVTHCGWNSTLEAVRAGVPLVAWPLYAEQRFNKILLVEEIKIALPMNESEDRFVSSDEIERRVKQIIDSEESEAVRKRVAELSAEAKKALNEGGSSKLALVEFLRSWKL